MLSGILPARCDSDRFPARSAPLKRRGASRTVIAGAIAGVILLGAALALLGGVRGPPIIATSTASSALLGTKSSSVLGEIDFSSPVAGETFNPGQTITISGRVVPTPTYQDTVTIFAYQSDSTTAIPNVQVLVGTNGTFSYSVTVSPYWYPGAYTVIVTDPSGAAGSEIFLLNDSS